MAHFVVLKDKNLKPENIKQGVKIFKVEGTYEGGGASDWISEIKRHDSSLNPSDIQEPLADLNGLSAYPYGSMALMSGPDAFTEGFSLQHDFTGEDAGEYGLAYAFAGSTLLDASITVQNLENAHGCWAGMFYGCNNLRDIDVYMHDEGPTPYTDGEASRLFERFLAHSCNAPVDADWCTVIFHNLKWANAHMFSEAFSNMGASAETPVLIHAAFPELLCIGWNDDNYTWLDDGEIFPDVNQNGVGGFYKAFHNVHLYDGQAEAPQEIDGIFPKLNRIYGNAVFSHAFEGSNIENAYFSNLCVIGSSNNSGNYGPFEGAFENSAVTDFECTAIYDRSDNADMWRDTFKNTSITSMFVSPALVQNTENCQNILVSINENNLQANNDIKLDTLEIDIPCIAYKYVEMTDPQDIDTRLLKSWLQVGEICIPPYTLSYDGLVYVLDGLTHWLDNVNDGFSEYFGEDLKWEDVFENGNLLSFGLNDSATILEYMLDSDDPDYERKVDAVMELKDRLIGYGFEIADLYETNDDFTNSFAPGTTSFEMSNGIRPVTTSPLILDEPIDNTLTEFSANFEPLYVEDKDNYMLRLYGAMDSGFGFQARIVSGDLIVNVFDQELMFSDIAEYAVDPETGMYNFMNGISIAVTLDWDLNEATVEVNGQSDTAEFDYMDSPISRIGLFGCIEGALKGNLYPVIMNEMHISRRSIEYYEPIEDDALKISQVDINPYSRNVTENNFGMNTVMVDGAAVISHETVTWCNPEDESDVYDSSERDYTNMNSGNFGDYEAIICDNKVNNVNNDWLTDALAGNITDLSGYELPEPGAEYQYQYLFANKTAVTDAPDMTNWTSITEDYSCYWMFNQCSNVTGHLDLSSITSITGDYACERFAAQTSFTSIDLSNLTTINGYHACYYMLAFNTSLQTLNIGSLNSIQGWQAFDQALSGLQYLTTLIVHPYVLSISSAVGLYTNVNRVSNLTLTANATDNVNIETWSLLTAASVLNVLTHLDLTVSGKSVNFYSSGLTVTDDAQGSIQTAYDAAVAAGWTINNLTITPDPGV